MILLKIAMGKIKEADQLVKQACVNTNDETVLEILAEIDYALVDSLEKLKAVQEILDIKVQ